MCKSAVNINRKCRRSRKCSANFLINCSIFYTWKLSVLHEKQHKVHLYISNKCTNTTKHKLLSKVFQHFIINFFVISVKLEQKWFIVVFIKNNWRLFRNKASFLKANLLVYMTKKLLQFLKLNSCDWNLLWRFICKPFR